MTGGLVSFFQCARAGGTREDRTLSPDIMRHGYEDFATLILDNHAPVFDNLKLPRRVMFWMPFGDDEVTENGKRVGSLQLHALTFSRQNKRTEHLPESFRNACKMLNAESFEVIRYDGQGDNDYGLNRKPLDDELFEYTRECGCSVAIDSLGARKATHPDAKFAKRLKAAGITVYAEPTKGGIWKSWPSITQSNLADHWIKAKANAGAEMIALVPADDNMGHPTTPATWATLRRLGFTVAAPMQGWLHRDMTPDQMVKAMSV